MPLSKLQKISYALKKKTLTIFGDLELHKFPCFFLYNPIHYKIKGKDFAYIQEHIQPYDVLLRRYDRYLDQYFIPGSWNHAGVYLPDGTILHAIAEGVVKESLFDFMKADYVCVLRPNFKYDPEQLNKTAEQFLGKEYDFSFDFTSGDRLSCTELAREFFSGCDHQIPITKSNFFFFSRDIVVPDSIYTANFTVVYDSTKASI